MDTSERELRTLRHKLLEWNKWGEEILANGKLDFDDMPLCFDRRQALENEMNMHRNYGSVCAYCEKPFDEEEIKVTEDHVKFYHAECKVFEKGSMPQHMDE